VCSPDNAAALSNPAELQAGAGLGILLQKLRKIAPLKFLPRVKPLSPFLVNDAG
jgi:hypothetical protein